MGEIFGESDSEKRNNIQDNIISTYNENRAKCQTVEELDKKITDGYDSKIRGYLYEQKFRTIANNEKNRVLDIYKKDKAIEALKEELLSRSQRSSTPERIQVPYVPPEIKAIKQRNDIEEENRKIASEELPRFLGVVQTDFSNKLKENIMKVKEKIETELSNYSPENLKMFLEKLTKYENLRDKLIEDAKKEIEKILEKSIKDSKHFNILILGKTGVGKSTLINGIFEYSKNEEAKTGDGRPITQEFGEYTSDKRKGLRIIDSKGIEMGEYNINAVLNTAKFLIAERAKEGNPDKLIHCIWYCLKSSNLRFEDVEKETLTLLMNQYHDNSLPIIIVITQNYDDKDTEIMTDVIKKEFQFLNREIIIMPVVAKEKITTRKNKQNVIEKDGIEELIQVSFQKSQNAILPAFVRVIEENVKQVFIENTKNRKEKVKNELKEIAQTILDKIKEKDKLGKGILKLSAIIVKTLNIFFELGMNNNNGNIENENEENINNIANEEKKIMKETRKLKNKKKKKNRRRERKMKSKKKLKNKKVIKKRRKKR